MSAHALLSPSGAHMWLHCPPSARLCAQEPNTDTKYTREGTLAHAIAELHLRKKYNTGMGPRKFAAELKKLKASPEYAREMDGHVQTYLDLVDEICLSYLHLPTVAVEARLDYSSWVPEGSGIGDCVIAGGDTLYVVDFKYGQGVPVNAEDNPQLKLYALGALELYGFVYDIRNIVAVICQPRRDSITRYETTPEALRSWADDIVPIARTAFDGEGERCSGDWCTFCRVKATCSTYSDTALLEDFTPDESVMLMTNEEIARRIEIIKPYVKALKALEGYALAECLAGREMPGFKAVTGRSARAFTDVDEAFKAAIKAGIPDSSLYVRNPLSPAKLEDELGKAIFKDVFTPYITVKSGKPTLVPINDKRPAITGVEADFEEEIDYE